MEIQNGIKLIAISGFAGAGKDTVAKAIQLLEVISSINSPKLVEAFKKQGLGSMTTYDTLSQWRVMRFAGKLKQIAGILLGVLPTQFENREFKESKLGKEWDFMTVREFLQRLGTDAVRNGLHTNAWVNATLESYSEELSWIIADCRFPNEAQAVKDRGGIVVRIVRPTVAEDHGAFKKVLHPSETALDDWSFDWVIQNDGSQEDLIHKVSIMLEHFGLVMPVVKNNGIN